MKIDVAIGVSTNAITVKSEIADYAETRLCRIALSKEMGETFEVVEDVGGDWTTESITAAGYERDKGSRSYRVINPFVPQGFEPYPSSMMIDFFCRKTFYTMKPKRGDWRLLFGFDSFDLKIKVENYLLISLDKRMEFEKLLSKNTSRKFVITQ